MSAADAIAGIQRCIPIYTASPGTKFGLDYNNTLTDMQNAVTNGQYCSSGIAAYNRKTSEATCVLIAGVLTNYSGDGFKNF